MDTSYLIKDLQKIDTGDITSCWQWKLNEMGPVVLVSCMGDMFLLGKDKAVYWLQTDAGLLSKVADDISHFNQLLLDEDTIDEWFLPLLTEELIAAGKKLKENEVYSLKIMTTIGGTWKIENIDPVDMSVHFLFTGQINEQIKNLPDGTPVKIVFENFK
jgi:hypothetical protein